MSSPRSLPALSDRSLPATLALTAVTVVTALGLGRLFATGAWVGPILVAAVGAHLVAWIARRTGLPAVVAYLLGAVVGALVVAWLVLPETTAYGVPLMGTFRAASHQLGQATTDFKKVVAPTPVTDGFVIASIIGVVACATVADWAAFRMHASFEAAIPAFTLFLFTAVLGSPKRMALTVAMFVAALLVFLVVHQAERASATTAWFAARSRGGALSLARGGTLLGIVAVITALLLGPHLPGAGQPAIIAWRNTDRPGPGNRSTVSPLVDIRGRLVDRSTVEVFTVKTNRKAYWRLTSLDTFDGDIWSSNGSYRPAHGGLPAGVASQATVDRVLQEYNVEALDSIWLPAAYEPERIDGAKHVSYNADSGSLISESDTSNGLTYKVQSQVPHLSPEQLDRAGTALPPLVRSRYLALPPIRPRVDNAARLAIAGARTPYAKALALERFFRKGDFVYDLNVAPGHDENALERFLRVKRGYCEQFAGAYAVMARAVGLPTRVAVGFTPGELFADGTYHVRGLNAHAWPEVYLDGFGWVAFEPTPGRGIPGAEAYTGVPEAQASPVNPSTATTVAPPTTAPSSGSNGPRVTQPDQGAKVRTNPLGRGHSRAPLFILIGLVLLGIVLLGWLAGVPLAKRAQRHRRRAAAVTPADQVMASWADALDALGQAGAPRRPWDTPLEYAARVDDPALSDLATTVTAASYSVATLGPDVPARAAASAAAVEHTVRSRLTRVQRLWWHLDPKPLWRSRPKRPRSPKLPARKAA
jgi:transglutaminase-like putative cysteine protease